MAKSKAQIEADMINDNISEAAYFAWRESQVRVLEENNKNRIGGIHVTTWNKACKRYIYYSSLKSKDVFTIDAEQAMHFYYGIITHQNTDLQGMLHEFTMAVDIKNDQVIVDPTKIVFTEENLFDYVIGTNDDMLQISKVGDRIVIVDKKTYNSMNYTPREPSEDYVEQINIYNYLINKCRGNKATHGTILYIDTATKGLKHTEFTFELDDVQMVELRLKEKRKAILQAKLEGRLPDRTKTFLCDGYCKHFYRCMLNK